MNSHVFCKPIAAIVGIQRNKISCRAKNVTMPTWNNYVCKNVMPTTRHTRLICKAYSQTEFKIVQCPCTLYLAKLLISNY